MGSIPFKIHERHQRLDRHQRPDRPDVLTATVWAGVVIDAPNGETIKTVRGVWTVPNVYLPDDAPDDVTYAVSSWIGIDGDGKSTDIIQVGVDCEICRRRGDLKPTITVTPWWEWKPDDKTPELLDYGKYQGVIANFEVHAGDTLSCEINVDKDSGRHVSGLVKNLNNGIQRPFSVDAPEGTELKGNCAEWIVEMIPVNKQRNLAKYGVVEFREAKAITDGEKVLQPGPPPKDFRWDNVKMVDGTQEISMGSSSTDHPGLVWCTYLGPARPAGMTAAAGKVNP
jgi:hypothetical protein